MYINALFITSFAALLSTITMAPLPNEKRSPQGTVTHPKLATITACTIPPLGAPVGCVDGAGYEKRSVDDKIVIGSKRSVDVEDKIVIGSRSPAPDDLPTISTDAASYVDQASYVPMGPTGDQASYADVGAYDEEKRKRYVVNSDDYATDLDGYPEEKREAEAEPLRPVKIEIDGDYPVPNDDSYPVKL
jgi:hypothetical protein